MAEPPPTIGRTGGKGAVQIERPSRIQRQVAQRMAESRATVPDFTLHTDVDMRRVVELRAQLQETAGAEDAVPSYDDIVVKACALALREHPRANGAYRDGAFERYQRVNVAVALSAQDSLIVPTIFDADRKSLTQIASESRALALRARDGQITAPELSGATFTVSSLGVYGVSSWEAIISPSQAAILAVGAVRQAPVVHGGAVVAGEQMSIALTCDHRILYGAAAAEFLARIRDLLEWPSTLVT